MLPVAHGVPLSDADLRRVVRDRQNCPHDIEQHTDELASLTSEETMTTEWNREARVNRMS
jgi:hypothetical protein